MRENGRKNTRVKTAESNFKDDTRDIGDFPLFDVHALRGGKREADEKNSAAVGIMWQITEAYGIID